jgi:hypothetical protein
MHPGPKNKNMTGATMATMTAAEERRLGLQIRKRLLGEEGLAYGSDEYKAAFDEALGRMQRELQNESKDEGDLP